MSAATVKHMSEWPEMLTLQDFRDFTGVGRQHAYRLANTKGFPAVRFGRCIRIPKAALLRWMDEQIGSEENWPLVP